jgi:spore coat protein CotF
MLNLTEKEKLLLKDEKSHEELCVKKYTKYSNEAEDPELQNLFTSILQHEQQHLSTINSMLNGQVPSMNQEGQQNQQATTPPTPSTATSAFSQKDCDMCEDTLATEKYISSTYDTSVFEFTDHNARQTLNHIQKEEQEHGEQIYNYMAMKGYYNA